MDAPKPDLKRIFKRVAEIAYLATYISTISPGIASSIEHQAQQPHDNFGLAAPVMTIGNIALDGRVSANRHARETEDWMATLSLTKPAQVDLYYQGLEKLMKERCEGELSKCPQRYQDYASLLYAGFRVQPAYRTWDTAHRQTFLTKAAIDPVLMQARKNWSIQDKNMPGYMDLDARKDVMRHVAAMYAESFSNDGANFTAPELVVGAVRSDADGIYDSSDHTMMMRAKDIMAFSFDDMMRITVHETQHGIQKQMGDMRHTADGAAYLSAHGIQYEAHVFSFVHNEGGLSVKTDDQAYAVSPEERDAYSHDVDGARVGTGITNHAWLFQIIRQSDATRSGFLPVSPIIQLVSPTPSQTPNDVPPPATTVTIMAKNDMFPNQAVGGYPTAPARVTQDEGGASLTFNNVAVGQEAPEPAPAPANAPRPTMTLYPGQSY